MDAPLKEPGPSPKCPYCGCEMMECVEEYVYNIGPTSRNDVPKKFWWYCKDCGCNSGMAFTREKAWLLAMSRPKSRTLKPGVPHIVYIEDNLEGEAMAKSYQSIIEMVDAGIDVTIRHKKHGEVAEIPVEMAFDSQEDFEKLQEEVAQNIHMVEQEECECECNHEHRRNRRNRKPNNN